MAKHPGSIDRHGSRWRIRLSVGGRRHRFYLDGGLPEEEVEKSAREKDTELRRRNGRGLPGPMVFSELLDRFEETRVPSLAPRTRETYGHSLEAFRTYFVSQGGDPMAHDVRPGHVQDFLHWRRSRSPNGEDRGSPLSARSLAKDRAVLHAVFSLAETLEVVQGNPVAKVTRPKGDAREPLILDAGQYEALLRACEGRPMLWLYVLVLGETGVRCNSEALWLRWEDVDFQRGFLTVESVRKGRRTKSGKSRKVPMTPRLRKALQDHAAAYRLVHCGDKRSPWVFHHTLTQRGAIAGNRLQSFHRAFAAAVKRAKLSVDLNQHDLRHRRVTTWLAEGKSPVLVQKAMGHADLATTMGYTHLLDDDLLALVDTHEDQAIRALAER
jgi:integrase